MFADDFDDNGQIEQIMTYYPKDREIPFANYEVITSQLPSLKKRFLYAKDFAKASMTDLFGKASLDDALVREANTFQSIYYENTGGLTFKAHDLPDELQFSTLNAAALGDLDNNGTSEVLLAGNFWENNIQMGRYDADYGHVLSIEDGGQMQVYPIGDLAIKGQVRRIAQIKANGQLLYLFAKNDAEVQVIRPLMYEDVSMQ